MLYKLLQSHFEHLPEIKSLFAAMLYGSSKNCLVPLLNQEDPLKGQLEHLHKWTIVVEKAFANALLTYLTAGLMSK